MPWTYDTTAPGAVARDRIRTLIRDVEQVDYSPSDELIASYLTTYSNNELRAALDAAKFRRDRYEELRPASRTAIGIQSIRNVSPSALDRVVQDLEARVSAAYRGGIQTFGISKSDTAAVEDDSDFPIPFTGVDRDSIPRPVIPTNGTIGSNE